MRQSVNFAARAATGRYFNAELLQEPHRSHTRLIFRMKTWLPAETHNGLRAAEAWRRREVRSHCQVLERFREERRAPVTGPVSVGAAHGERVLFPRILDKPVAA